MQASSFEELHALLVPFRGDKRWLFRGQSDAQWPLLPKAGRPQYSEVDDALVFEAWKRQAIEFVSRVPASDWEWLAIAQHHGLATRLLDWSMNPLYAAFFAVRDNAERDASITAVKFKHKVVPEKAKPFEFKDVAIHLPQRVVPRITRQGGVFSIHPNPERPLTPKSSAISEMKIITIPSSARARLKAELSFYGVNALSLFPDLDGLAEFTNWSIESKEYWTKYG
ncbi:FRG domain-containing protein [Rhodanobacter aciditrophus]|uniref:FRG domain-containing protein n=1 Tax=Rhodanobacter aciditrophus TaxID=1623218 RepID=UPI003CE80C27